MARMPVEGDEWALTHHGLRCGVITVRGIDQPWVLGTWAPTAEFAPLAPLFERDLAVSRADNWDDAGVADLEGVWAEIRKAVDLHYPDGRIVPEFLLHIDGTDAWFRWNDEPFE